MNKNRFFAFIYFLSISLLIADSTSYQYYEPVESDKVDKFIEAALKELSFFGKPNIPIKEIHIRRSDKVRAIPRLFSRADINDWPALKKALNTWAIEKKFLRRYLNYSAVEIDTKSQKMSLIKALNSMLKDKNFYTPERFPELKLTDTQEKYAGLGFWGSFSADKIKLNRSLIETKFKDAINPFKFIKRPHINMQFCELADTKRGKFVIYLKHEAETDKFYCELAHEIFHTLNAKVYDWNVEGLASLFSEELVQKQGKDWRYFRDLLADQQTAYGASYHLLEKLYKNNKNIFKDFMQHSVDWHRKKKKIDINAWLQTLSSSERSEYSQKLKQLYKPMTKNSSNYIEFN